MLRRTRRRHAFTLVELLVVIGIIVILISILIPVLSGARRRAEQIQCASNLRTLGEAMAMYTSTTGYYPGALIAPPNLWASVWQTRLRRFLNGNRAVFLCPARDPERFAWTDHMQNTMGPAPASMSGYGYEEGEPILGYLTLSSYGYNAYGEGTTESVPQQGLGSDVSPGRGSGRPREVRFNRIRIASEMIAIADSNGDGMYDSLIAVELGSLAAPGAIHRGGLNVLYCDGHVQWQDRKEVTVPDDPSIRLTQRPWRDIVMLWRNDHQLDE